MRNLILGAAVIALASGGAYADPGNKGKGRDNDRRANASAEVRTDARAKGNRTRVLARAEARQDNRQDRRAERRGDERQENVRQRSERREDIRQRSGNREENNRQRAGSREEDNRQRANRLEDERQRAARREDEARRAANRRDDNDDDRRRVIRRADDDDNRRRVITRDGRRVVVIRDDDDNDRRRILFRRDRDRGLINGCPPGLAKKRNGCMPPGLVRAMARENRMDRNEWRRELARDWDRRWERNRFGYGYRPSLFGLTNYYDDYDDDDRYYYDDGYLYRLDDSFGVRNYIPLLGGALAIGNPWPSAYTSYNVPNYYVDYYNLGGPSGYRYADNVLYRVNPEDAAITSIAALLTGNDISVGQRMPMGYDVYNVPYQYRDRYYDTPQAHYRYSDGYVYRIDPTTQLVAAAIDLLV